MRARLADRIPIRLQRRNRLGGFADEVLASSPQCSQRARFKLAGARHNRLQTPAFRLVLGKRERQRAPCAIGCGRGVADLLIEDQKRIPIGEILFGRCGCPPHQCPNRLEHCVFSRYEQRSQTMANLSTLFKRDFERSSTRTEKAWSKSLRRCSAERI